MSDLFRPDALAGLHRRLAALEPDTPARWGRMSAHQAVCHLADSFAAVLGERPVARLDLPWYMRSAFARFVALSLPVPWPRGVPTAPEVDQDRGGTTPGDFAADVERLRSLMARFHASGGRGLTPHPVFGELRPGPWGRWGWRHVDHHLRQFGM